MSIKRIWRGFHSALVEQWPDRVDQLLILLALLLFALQPHKYGGDGMRRFRALTALLEHGELTEVKYSLIGPLFSTPLWLAGKLVGTPQDVCAFYNWLLFALGLAGLHWLLRDLLDRRTSARLLLLLTFASTFSDAQLHWGGEMFTAVCLATGLTALVTGRFKTGAVLVVLGTANTPASIVAIVAVAVYLAAVNQRARFLLIPAATVALILLEAWLRRGDPFAGGYENDHGFRTVLPYSGQPGFSYPFALGVVSILFSFGKGLLVFVPGLLLVPGLVRNADARLRTLAVSSVFVVAGMVAVYASWWAWYGGAGWGPRFFLFACFPACLALAVHSTVPAKTWRTVLPIAVLAWSFWVGANGLVFGTHGLGQCFRDRYALELLCWYVPEFSPLARPFIETKALSLVDGLALVTWGIAAIWAALLPALALGPPARHAGRWLAERARELRAWRF